MYSNLTNLRAIASTQLRQLFQLVLKSGVKLIRKCGFTRNNQTPWVSYINIWGQSCSHFIKKSLFAGFDIQVNGDWAIVTELGTGQTYSVNLESGYCSCPDSKQSNYAANCKHIKAVAKLYPQLEQAIAQQELEEYIEQQSLTLALPRSTSDLVIGDRVKVNSLRKHLRQLGEVKNVGSQGATVEIDGNLVWLFFDELTKQAEPLPSMLNGYNPYARGKRQVAQNWEIVRSKKEAIA